MWIAIALTCLTFAVWLYQNLVEKETTFRTPPSAEARQNPLLAAQRMFQALQQETASVRGTELLQALPSHNDTLLVYQHNTPFTQERFERLWQWVEQGGHLILDLSQLSDEQRDISSFRILAELAVEIDRDGARLRDLVEVDFDLQDGPVTVRFDTPFTLLDTSGRAIGSVSADQGYHLLQYEVGVGQITLINDLEMISNDRIGDHEHAYFAFLLARSNGKLWLLYDPFRKSLFALLLEHAGSVLLSLLLLGLAWVWQGARRFAPLQTEPSRIRRDLMQHVVAVGAFEERHALMQTRFAATQASIEHRWMLRHPQLLQMNESERAQWIAEQAGEDPSEVQAALYTNYSDELEFVSHSALLARIRRWT